MVRRFRTTSQYPNTYSDSWGNVQSGVPSQNSPVPPPYDPSRQPDLIPTPPFIGNDFSDVRHVFDSRPPMAYDWFFTDKIIQSIYENGGYTVPDGFILILRRVSVHAYQLVGEALQPTLTQFGDTDFVTLGWTPELRITVNNNPVTTWTVNNSGNFGGVPLYDLFGAGTDIDTFVLVDGGQTVNVEIPPITDPAQPLISDSFAVTVQYYGNMLLSKGRTLPNEVGNDTPIPTKES